METNTVEKTDALPEEDNGQPTENPTPQLTPEKVIEIQMKAMKNNDTPNPDAGIATTFKFASPSNKAMTGPLPRFINMVHNRLYEVLLCHKSSKFVPMNFEGNQWQINIVDKNGDSSTFIWVLTKQTSGTFKDCWMVDSVMRIN